jgi:hypothetical protein
MFRISNASDLIWGREVFRGEWHVGIGDTETEHLLASGWLQIATLVEACYGMGSTLAVKSVKQEDLPCLRGQNAELRSAVQALLAGQFASAENILMENRTALEEIAAELMVGRHLLGGQSRPRSEDIDIFAVK